MRLLLSLDFEYWRKLVEPLRGCEPADMVAHALAVSRANSENWRWRRLSYKQASSCPVHGSIRSN